MHLKHGSVLQGGKYRIEKLLGQGGFGITYLAVQAGLNRNVAIKEFFMKEHCNRDVDTSHVSVPSVGSRDLVAKYRSKFLKEAGTIAALDNPHVVRIHDVFEENGTAYYVMEYLGDDNLAKRISPSGMPHEEAATYVRQIGEALSYIHSQNILHLDVKPSNVMFRHGTEVVIIDFGISKHYDGADGGQTSTSAGCVSEGYSPMEQYEADGVSSFTAATDIYSLGATLYHLLCGRRPSKASVILNEGLDFPESMPQAYRDFIKKAMQPRRKDRPQSMQEFLYLLNEAYMQSSKESCSGEVVDDVHTQIYSDNPQQQGGSSVNDENNHDTGNETIVQGDDKHEIPKPKNRTWLWGLCAFVLFWFCVFQVALSDKQNRHFDNLEDVDTTIVCSMDSAPCSIECNLDDTLMMPTAGMLNGHEWVDLGLPSGVKWATCNVGASTPGDYGNHYAWGEIVAIENGNYSIGRLYGKQAVDIGANVDYDASSYSWGGGWRMPTKEEFEELINNCDWRWDDQDGHEGYLITSHNTELSIFLPSTGYIEDDYNLTYARVSGCYWSSSPSKGKKDAYALYFDNWGHGYQMKSVNRGVRRSIRPVLED